MYKLLLTIATIIMFAASFGSPVRADELAGTRLGVGVGGLIGSQFGHGSGRVAATSIGIVASGWIGSEVGRPHYSDYGYTLAYYSYGPPTYFYNDADSYTPNYVAPPAPAPDPPVTYVDGTSQGYCREFSQIVRINGLPQESYGTVCLQSDGTWRVVQ